MWHWGRGGTGIPLDFHIDFEQSLHFYREEDQFVVEGEFHFSSCSKLGGFTKTFWNDLATSLLLVKKIQNNSGDLRNMEKTSIIHHFFHFLLRFQHAIKKFHKEQMQGLMKWILLDSQMVLLELLMN